MGIELRIHNKFSCLPHHTVFFTTFNKLTAAILKEAGLFPKSEQENILTGVLLCHPPKINLSSLQISKASKSEIMLSPIEDLLLHVSLITPAMKQAIFQSKQVRPLTG